MDKQKKLDEIAEEIRNCRECKIGKIGEAVPGEGNPDADVVFLGEAPGKTEAATGRPFIGRSGKLLRSMIRSVGLTEEEVFITSPVKYLPERGTPTPADVAHGREHLLKQLEVIEPKFIVLLGSVAIQGALGEKMLIVANHGQIFERNGRNYMVTFHPAAILRFQKNRPSMEQDFQKLKQMLNISRYSN